MTESTKDHARFLRFWLITLSGLLSLAALFNYMVDPYGLFDTDRIDGFNAIKPVAASHVRTAKPYQVDTYSPRTIIAGNSRPEIGLDPRNRCWPPASRPIFNLGLPGASIYMQARTLQHAVAGNEVDLVLWGLDFIDFLVVHTNRRNRWETPQRKISFEQRLRVNADGSNNGGYPWKKLEDHFQALVSLNTLKDSLSTAFGQHIPHASTIRRDGFNPALDYLEIIAWEGQRVLFQQKKDDLIKTFSRPGLNLYTESTRWSQEFESVKRFLQLAERDGVNVVLFINPYHSEYLATLQSTGNWDYFEQWKRRLTILADDSGVKLWDFSTTNSLSTEKVPESGDRKTILKWFWEPAHYRSEFGDLMLSQMLQRSCGAGETAAVGQRLTPENIDTHLARSQREMKQHTDNHN